VRSDYAPDMSEDRTVEAVVEAPRGSFVKRRADGRVDFVSPLPCPYNYGSLPGTVSGDGDPVDAVILGPRRRAGERVRLPVRAEVRFVDEGRDDTKLVLSAESLGAMERAGLVLFFTVYARAKHLLARLRGRGGEIAFRGLVLRD
jgi:inorganic pyrophosphatase